MEREDLYLAQIINTLTDSLPLSLELIELVGRYIICGKHSFLVFSEKFVIDNSFQLIKPRSRNRLSTVCCALDRQRGLKVCIEKKTKIFDDKQEIRQALKELRLLRFLSKHENILSLIDILPSPAGCNFEDIYVVTEYVDSDLEKVLRSKKTSLSEDQIHYIIYQLISALKYCHSVNVVHGNIQPEQILVFANCDIRLSFSSASTNSINERSFVSLSYLPPEMLCTNTVSIQSEIDMWGVGCVLAEMYSRKPLFAGATHQEQLRLMVEYLGKPTEEECVLLSTHSLSYLQTLPPSFSSICVLRSLLPSASDLALDLLSKLLTFDARLRLTAEEALVHPFFACNHSRTLPVTELFQGDVHLQGWLSPAQTRSLMMAEIAHFRPWEDTNRTMLRNIEPLPLICRFGGRSGSFSSVDASPVRRLRGRSNSTSSSPLMNSSSAVAILGSNSSNSGSSSSSVRSLESNNVLRLGRPANRTSNTVLSSISSSSSGCFDKPLTPRRSRSDETSSLPLHLPSRSSVSTTLEATPENNVVCLSDTGVTTADVEVKSTLAVTSYSTETLNESLQHNVKSHAASSVFSSLPASTLLLLGSVFALLGLMGGRKAST